MNKLWTAYWILAALAFLCWLRGLQGLYGIAMAAQFFVFGLIIGGTRKETHVDDTAAKEAFRKSWPWPPTPEHNERMWRALPEDDKQWFRNQAAADAS